MKTFSPQARSLARERVLQALYQWQLAGDSIQTIEDQFLTEQDMRRADVPYFKKLLHGIPSKINFLNEKITPFLDRQTEQLDPIEHAILHIGCYELYYCDIPWRVAINESVELAKKFGAEQSYKYVNGILDKVARHIEKTL